MAEQDQRAGALRAEPDAGDAPVTAAPTPPGGPGAGGRSALRRLLPALLLVAGIAVGFVAALAVTGRGPFAPAASLEATVETVGDPIPPADAAVGAPAAAASGRAAVERFIAAEIAGDFAESYRHLRATDRDSFRSAAGWEAAHAEVLPPITGFETGRVDRTRDGVTVTGTLRLEPGLDEVVGLIPAEAEATWVAVEGPSGSWGVDLDASTLAPRYPADDGAADAAVAWARARQRCEQVGEYDGGLLGVGGPADALCNATGPVEVGRPERLDDLDAAPFQAAFGDDATAWARVVDVRAPRTLRVVLAPVGSEWLVIGVLPAVAG